MEPWQPGQPTGAGLTYLPTDQLRAAYYAQDTEARLRGLAIHLLKLPTHEARELAGSLQRKHGAQFVDRLRAIAKQIKNDPQ